MNPEFLKKDTSVFATKKNVTSVFRIANNIELWWEKQKGHFCPLIISL